MGTLRVDVTAEDIGQGEPRVACRCPVALALKRAAGPILPDLDEVFVYGTYILFSPVVFFALDYSSVPTPAAVVSFIDDFDADRAVAPFAFDLDVPEASS
jgi:hypothetical protein